jgi:HEAT repeat protein
MNARMLLPAAALLCGLTCSESLEPDPQSDVADARAAWLRQQEPPLEGGAMVHVLKLLDDPHPMPRMEALGVVARIGDARLWDHVGPRLEDPVARVRQEACKAAGKLNNPEAIPALAKTAAARGEEAEVRQEAVGALVRFGARQDVVRALIDVLNEGGRVQPRPQDRLIGEMTVVYKAHEGLKKLTGQSGLADDRVAWEAWYKSKYGDP